MSGGAERTEETPVAGEPLERLLDGLLAEYFGWIDRGHLPDMEAFLANRDPTVDDPELVAALSDYIESTQSIEVLASFATVGWIDPERSAGGFDGDDLPSDPPRPSSIAPMELGDYELLEEIGRGGMGIVYKARHRALDRTVCIKMVLLGRLAGEGEIQRFRNESQAMARLRHPNLVTVYEVGRLDEQDYFSMEYIGGATLADRAAEGPLPAEEAARFLYAIAQAIHYAHENGLLHRDLKPSNILIDEFGQPRVTDFGLARWIDAGSLTRTGNILGTPSYMSPEQTRGLPGTVDARSDVYGLGAILYELSTGRPPFQGETPLDTLMQVRQAEPVAPGLLNPRVPRDLETICLKCLDKEPTRRYSSAAALASDLKRFLQHEPVHARPVGHVQRFHRWCRRNPLAFTLGATVLLALSVVAGTTMVAYRITAAALTDAETARDQQTDLADELRRQRDSIQNHLYLSQIDRARQAIEGGDLIEAAELLQRQVPFPGEADRRGWEWFYLHSLLGQFERSWDAHSISVHAVAWSPSDRRIASVGEDQTLRVWDGLSGEVLHSIDDLDGVFLDAAWHPLGEDLASASSNGTLQIWNLESGTLRHELRGATDPLRSLSWSPSGDRLAAGGDRGDISLWAPADGTGTVVFSGHTERVNSVQWAPNGAWLASASDDGTVRIWNDADRSEIAVLRGQGDWINAIAWSPDSRHLAAVGQEGFLQVWTIDSDRQAGNFRVSELYTRVTSERKPWLAVAWSEDGTVLATGGVSPRLMIWNAAKGDPVQRLHGHLGPVRRLSFQLHGRRFASASADGTVKTWAMESRHSGEPLYRGDSPIRAVAWSSCGGWLAWRDIDGGVSVWNDERDQRMLHFSESPVGATGLAWHPQQPQIALTRDDTVSVFTVPHGRQLLQLDGHQGPVWTTAWDPSGRRIATGSSDRSVMVWDSRSGERLQTLDGHPGDVRFLAWSRDGRRLATVATGGTIRLWDAATGVLEQAIVAETVSINDLAWSWDGSELAAAVHEGLILRWNVGTGEAMAPLRGHHRAVWHVIWSDDGSRLFSCGQDGSLRVWDSATAQELLKIDAHEDAVWSMSLSPDGRRLVSSGVDRTVRIWNGAKPE